MTEAREAGELGALVTRAEELAGDLELRAVREWKDRTGAPAIGYLPVYAPRELLWAQGVLPVGILGGGEIEIIRGDAYYQSYICHIPRSTIELALNGSLDALDGMLFPATCDVIRNLSGMWQMLFPGKLVRYLDVPQDFHASLGGAFWRRELEELATALAERGAAALDSGRLSESIRVHNEHRREVCAAYALRREQPWKVPSHELYVVMRAGFTTPVTEHTEFIRRYRTLAAADASRKPMDQARVLLTGAFCEQPPMGLIRTLERAGCYIVDDDLLLGHRWIEGDVSLQGDPLDALVGAFLERSVASAIRFIDGGEKGQDLLERARRSGAEGVLFAAPSFCDPALLDQPMLTAACDRAGIPWTAFKYSENGGQFQVIREQAGTFADSIKLWSDAS